MSKLYLILSFAFMLAVMPLQKGARADNVKKEWMEYKSTDTTLTREYLLIENAVLKKIIDDDNSSTTRLITIFVTQAAGIVILLGVVIFQWRKIRRLARKQ